MAVEIVDAHSAEVGGVTVRRMLPRHGRRTVGPWCFVDHFGPEIGAAHGMQVGPHPHIGLRTVTWLLEGLVVHTDSLGSDVAIRPGQLNVMTAGAGVAHAEQTPGDVGAALHGLQLWVAQPESDRHGPAGFQHHAELPRAELDGGTATVLMGELAGVRSPAGDDGIIGVDLDLRPGRTTMELRTTFEHLVLPIDGPVDVDSGRLVRGQGAVLPAGGDEVTIDVAGPTRVAVLGGTPWAEPILMWWNFVARTKTEVEEARADWQAGSPRFGAVASGLTRIEAPPTPWPR